MNSKTKSSQKPQIESLQEKMKAVDVSHFSYGTNTEKQDLGIKRATTSMRVIAHQGAS